MDAPTPTFRTIRRTARRSLLVALGLVVLGALSSGADQGLTVAAARTQLAQARSTREQAQAHLADLQARRATLQARLDSGSAASVAIANQVADARRRAREQAIRAYVSGNEHAQLSIVLQSHAAADASVRTDLLAQSSVSAAQSARAYQRLKDHADPAVAALGLELDRLDNQIDQAHSDLDQAAALEADAEHALADARDRARQASAATRSAAPTTAPSGPAPAVARPVAVTPAAGAGAGADKWAKLRNCESGGNYRAVSASGRYRGAYQFDQQTWNSVGGTGDPAAAAPAEQDLRAQRLYQERGVARLAPLRHLPRLIPAAAAPGAGRVRARPIRGAGGGVAEEDR